MTLDQADFTRLSEAHLDELAHLAPTMLALWRALDHVDGDGGPRRGD
jgi:hypothetical protein